MRPVHPRLVREELRSSARFQAGLARLARELGRDEADVAREADSHLREMVTGWAKPLLTLGVRLGRCNYRRAHAVLRRGGAAGHATSAATPPRSSLPSHKSNPSSLLLTSPLNRPGLPQPHIFGAINRAFGPIGPIFRRAAPAYIRRTTRGEPV